MCLLFFAIFSKKVNIINIYSGRIVYWDGLFTFITNIWYYKSLFQLSNDIKLNPGSKPNSYKSFWIFHWNLNSITSLSFIKVSFLTVYNSIHKFDFFFYLRRTEILKQFQMTQIWIYQVKTLIKLTICQTPSVWKFASTSRNH